MVQIILNFIRGNYKTIIKENISDDKIRELGWNRKYRLEDGLNKTGEWYKQNY